MAGSALHVDAIGLLKDSDLLGRLVETLVATQLRAELPVCESRPRLYHLRLEQGRREVDLIAELGAFGIVAMEVKTGAPDGSAARHLVWLREQLGDRFLHGVVFHTGSHLYQLDEKITAVPICSLWA